MKTDVEKLQSELAIERKLRRLLLAKDVSTKCTCAELEHHLRLLRSAWSDADWDLYRPWESPDYLCRAHPRKRWTRNLRSR